MKYVLIVLSIIVLILVYIASHSLPSLEGRSESTALSEEESKATPLGQALAEQIAAHPGESGIIPLANAQNAFAARVMLARTAQRTLDVQYYIWRNDLTGNMLLHELYLAAERGVRVRILLDDHGTPALDQELAALDQHPNIEVRLFNPFAFRTPKLLNFLTDFFRLNRRMHNKTFTADSQATIIGGRNIGDEYFGAYEGFLFADLDVVTVGAVVPEVSADFDRYWASDSSYPVSGILAAAKPGDIEKLIAQASTDNKAQEQAQQYLEAIFNSETVSNILKGDVIMHWSKVVMYSDDPRKGLGLVNDEELLITRLNQILGSTRKQVELVSPYFVPTAAGVDAFSRLAATGADIRTLTNSLLATDVTAVHAAYAKRRKDLLTSGVRLFEMKPQGDDTPEEKAGPFGSSASSLHAKTFSVDGKRVFVGSFNFDPRSANLNTELGFIIDTEAIAQDVRNAFDEIVPLYAYEVKLDTDGKLYWLEQVNGQTIRHDKEPGATLLNRLWIEFLARLPIEWLL